MSIRKILAAESKENDIVEMKVRLPADLHKDLARIAKIKALNIKSLNHAVNVAVKSMINEVDSYSGYTEKTKKTG